MPNWTLVTNHATVLLHIAQHPRTTAREIAGAAGITERATRKIIADLDDEHFIAKKKEGRRIFYTINSDAKMRAENVQEVAVGKFLEVLGWQKVMIEVPAQKPVGNETKSLIQAYKIPEQKEKLVEEFYAHQIF